MEDLESINFALINCTVGNANYLDRLLILDSLDLSPRVLKLKGLKRKRMTNKSKLHFDEDLRPHLVTEEYGICAMMQNLEPTIKSFWLEPLTVYEDRQSHSLVCQVKLSIARS